jgi:hypothetical protein
MLKFVSLLVLIMAVARRLYGTPPDPARRTWSGRSGSWGVVWLLAGPTWLATMLWLRMEGFHPVACAALAVTTLLLFPWPITRMVLIPLGLSRLAASVTRLADWTWSEDPTGGAALAAVLAASQSAPDHGVDQPAGGPGLLARCRRMVSRPADVASARQRLQGLDLVSAGGVMAAAVMADSDNDHEAGDALAASLDHFDPQVVPVAALRLRAERTVWRLMANTLITDDERRRTLLDLPRHGSSTVALVQALVRRQDEPTPRHRAAVGWWWLMAPRKRHTWALLRGTTWLPTTATTTTATTATTATTTTTTTTATTTTTTTLTFGAAAQRHAELAAREVVLVVDVAELAGAWEQALADAVATVRARATVLGVHGDDAEDGLRATVHNALVSLVNRLDLSAVDTATLPAGMQRAIDDVRSQRMDALEITVAAWRLRLQDAIDRQPIDELREWTALRRLGGAVARTGSNGAWLAHEASQWVVCELAVRLWNVRREHRLANAIFRSLLDDATRVGDTRGAETQRANIACGP